MKADGTDQIFIDTPYWGPGGYHQDPTGTSWSPDGKKIAFTVDDHCDGGGLWTVNTDGTDLELVSCGFNSGINSWWFDPAWSPRGDQIAFAGPKPPGGYYSDIYLAIPGPYSASTNITHTTLGPNEYEPDWSPNATKIVFARDSIYGDSPPDLYVINSDGSGGPTQITTDGQSNQPAWSPDGTLIAFASSSLDTLRTMNPDGTGVTPIPNTAVAKDPTWQPIVTGYVRPKGATPILISLVPAYRNCPTTNREHGGSLAEPSCNPPAPFSSSLTVGTPDANGAAANSISSARFDVCPVLGCAVPNVKVAAAISDVRCKAGVATCGASNAAGGADYTGELSLETTIRITDRDNSPAPDANGAGTMIDYTLAIPLSCNETGSDAQGAACGVSTTVNSVVPGAVEAGMRAIWELQRSTVRDGGVDGVVSTTADNTRFLSSGLFVP
jgi:hypothetical protein